MADERTAIEPLSDWHLSYLDPGIRKVYGAIFRCDRQSILEEMESYRSME